MNLITNWGRHDARERLPAVFSLGVFDGLHLGHKFLIEQVIKNAKNLKAKSLLLSFEPHPLSILAPRAAPPLLTTLKQKAAILESWGLDYLGVLTFDKNMAAIPAQKFLVQYLGKYIEPKGAVLGPDFTFGQNAKGNHETVAAWMAKVNPYAKLSVIEALKGPEGLYSSSCIRQNIKSGLVENVALALGRPYQLNGKIIHGQARGRTLGFPTANLGEIEQLIPQAGVYAVNVLINGEKFEAMCSIGYNPTFAEQALTVESHIFDFNRFVYGVEMSIEFISRLRGMIKFESVEQLISQLENDKKEALGLLRRF